MPKLSRAQVVEIYAAEGSHRSIAARYGVCHTSIGDIKRRWRVPRNDPVEPERFTTPIGTVVSAELVNLPTFVEKYSAKVRFSARDAAAIISNGKRAIRDKTKELTDSGVTGADAFPVTDPPYRVQPDGSYVVRFRTQRRPRQKPVLRNVEGNKLRKPELVKRGRKVSVVYSVVAHYRRPASSRYDVEGYQDYAGLWLIYSLHEIVLFSGS